MAVHTNLRSLFTDIADKLREKGAAPDSLGWVSSDVSSSWNDICYGNGKFVAVHDTGVDYSPDGGKTWVQVTLKTSSGSDPYLKKVCYGGGLFVTLNATCEAAFYSADGITWSTADTNISIFGGYIDICYGNGKFVALLNANAICAYSTDGATWTTCTSSVSGGPWSAVCYGGDKFVVTGYGYVAYSTDGIEWTGVPVPRYQDTYSIQMYDICYNGSKFVAIGDYYSAVSSTDGISWQCNNTQIQCDHVCYGDGKFVARGADGNLLFSPDGIEWTVGTYHKSVACRSLQYAEGAFWSWDGDDTMACGVGSFVADLFPNTIASLPFRLITNDESIVPTGQYADSAHYNVDYGVKIGYCPNGDIMVSMQGGTSTSYESILFNLASAPEGVTITTGKTLGTSGVAGALFLCFISGLTAPASMSIVMDTRNSSTDSVQCDITIIE